MKAMPVLLMEFTGALVVVNVMKQDLREYGFTQDYNELRCRICNGIIHKHGVAVLLGITVKYGWCRWYTHGVSVVKLMK